MLQYKHITIIIFIRNQVFPDRLQKLKKKSLRQITTSSSSLEPLKLVRGYVRQGHSFETKGILIGDRNRGSESGTFGASRDDAAAHLIGRQGVRQDDVHVDLGDPQRTRGDGVQQTLQGACDRDGADGVQPQPPAALSVQRLAVLQNLRCTTLTLNYVGD